MREHGILAYWRLGTIAAVILLANAGRVWSSSGDTPPSPTPSATATASAPWCGYVDGRLICRP
jgi:hypothetical protein